MKKEIQKLAKKYPSIKLVYLFGSRARGDEGPLSDYDFAIYLDEQDEKTRFDVKLSFMMDLSGLLKVNNVDLLVLNDVDKPELKYDVIKEGELLYEIEPYSLLVEPQILNDYFDFREVLRRNHLTKA